MHDGRIGRTHRESVPWFETPPAPPAGSPDVIFVVFDDVGFSDFACFGSALFTPAIDALAARGLRYTNFHTTTLCSPTRACLLTGRNHHAVGMRYLSNIDMGWPSGRGAVTRRAATIAEILLERSYGTLQIGKWHLAPTEHSSAAGPFDQWPLARGFERFYGFMNGSTDQFVPELVEDNKLVEPPATEGYHLSADLVDATIGILRDRFALTPSRPYFLNLAFGAGHWPHHAPPELLARNRGRFDHGWDVERERRLARQRAMGIVPPAVELPPPNPGVARWADVPREQQLLACRLQEAYAALVEHADAQLGRLIAFLAEAGRLENTLVVLISDNGASIDCGVDGTTNVLRWFNGLPEPDGSVPLEAIGGPRSYTNYPWGWAQASNTPCKLYKSFTHGGGVRDPLIVSWPRGIAEHGALRHQFVHAIDIAPTVLDVCAIAAPATYRGVPQLPMHGRSFAPTFSDPSAPAPRSVQYFEMYGNRGIWHDGWKAVTNHESGASFDDEKWELYHLAEDFAETRDLATERPEKLREMVERWWAEAGKYDVMPLDDRREILFKPVPTPHAIRAMRRFRLLPPVSRIPAECAPMVQDASHRIDVRLARRATDDGVLVAYGNAFGGFALFVDRSYPVYVYNACGELTYLRAGSPLPTGSLTVSFAFSKTGPFAGRTRLEVDGVAVAEGMLQRTLLRTSLAPLTVGRGQLPPVCADIAGTAPFTGTIHEVVCEVGDDGGRAAASLDID